MASQSKNVESTRREENGVVYYDRGVLEGRDGRRYQRYAVQTHFVEEALKQEFGRKTTLRELGRQAPDIQYNVMYNRIV